MTSMEPLQDLPKFTNERARRFALGCVLIPILRTGGDLPVDDDTAAKALSEVISQGYDARRMLERRMNGDGAGQSPIAANGQSSGARPSPTNGEDAGQSINAAREGGRLRFAPSSPTERDDAGQTFGADKAILSLPTSSLQDRGGVGRPLDANGHDGGALPARDAARFNPGNAKRGLDAVASIDAVIGRAVRTRRNLDGTLFNSFQAWQWVERSIAPTVEGALYRRLAKHAANIPAHYLPSDLIDDAKLGEWLKEEEGAARAAAA